MTKAHSFEKTYLPALLCAGFVLRLLIVLKAPCIEMDGIGYATIADQLARGLFREGLNNVFSPMYPLFVGLLHIVVRDVELAGRLVSLFFGVLLIWISFLFADRLLRDKGRAAWAAALIAFHPYLIRYSGVVLSESTATFFFVLTVFSFYVGWQEQRRGILAASGFCLVLTYLTRPEYLVFYAPLIILLLGKRRPLDCLALLLPFLILGAIYISYLHHETGVWTVSKRTSLSPFVSLGSFIHNIPSVSYDFVAAILPLTFLLALLGSFGIRRPYRNLVMILILFHILSLSFISHSSKRYSVEFVPILLIFAAQGVYAVRAYFTRFAMGPPVVACVLAAAIAFTGIIEPFAPVPYERALDKKAGLFLLEHDPGRVIAARLPLVAFYAKGGAVNLLSEMESGGSASRLDRLLADRRVGYLVVDEELEREMPFLKIYLSLKTPICSLDRNDRFVRVYKVS